MIIREAREPTNGQQPLISQDPEPVTGMQQRLDNQRLLNDFRKFISGKDVKVQWDAQTSSYLAYEIELPGVRCKANPEGTHGIMLFLSSVLNAPGVQGNMKREQYDAFMRRAHMDIATLLLINRRDWSISKGDYALLVSSIMNIVEMFASRTIDNKERESYIPIMKYVESNTIREPSQQQQTPFLGGFGHRKVNNG